MATESSEPLKLFYSYDPRDEELREEQEKHLTTLRRNRYISGWHQKQINAGMDTVKESLKYLNKAQIILLLVSPDYLASEYCYDIEVLCAMERHEVGEARVIPILLRPVDIEDTPFEKLNVLPTNGVPIKKWPDQDEAFYDVAQGIKKIVQELKISLGVPKRRTIETLAPTNTSRLVVGAEDFIVSIDAAPETSKKLLWQLCDWAIALERAGLVKLSTYHGKAGILTLLPRLKSYDAGLVSIYNNNGLVYMQFWRSVFEHRAPRSLDRIEQSFTQIKQGNTIREVSDELLNVLSEAYREAAGKTQEAFETPRLVEGAQDFITSIEREPEASKKLLWRLCNWAIALERARLVKLSTYHGKAGILTLLPRLIGDTGLASIYNNNGTAYLQLHRSVFERRAPKGLASIEKSINKTMGPRETIREVNDELLNVLTAAYREAAGGAIEI